MTMPPIPPLLPEDSSLPTTEETNLVLLAYRMGRVEVQVREGFHAMELRMASSLLSREVYDVKHEELTRRVADLEDAAETHRRDKITMALSLIGTFGTALTSIIVVLVHTH